MKLGPPTSPGISQHAKHLDLAHSTAKTALHVFWTLVKMPQFLTFAHYQCDRVVAHPLTLRILQSLAITLLTVLWVFMSQVWLYCCGCTMAKSCCAMAPLDFAGIETLILTMKNVWAQLWFIATYSSISRTAYSSCVRGLCLNSYNTSKGVPCKGYPALEQASERRSI